MSKVSGEIHIDAPKETVWAVLADLGAVSVWNPTTLNSYWTSETKDGVGITRHCDFPEGGYVKERVVEWQSGKVMRLSIYDSNVPSDNFFGAYALEENAQGTTVTFTLEYDVKPDALINAIEADRQNREELIPAVLAGLKHYVETGEALPMPAPA